MTRSQADQTLKAFFSRHGLGAVRLNAKGLAGVRVGTTTVSFEWDAAGKALACRALVYRFEAAPKPKVLARVLKAGKTLLEFHRPSRALFVAERLTQAPAAEDFDLKVGELVKQAGLWATQKLAASASA